MKTVFTGLMVAFGLTTTMVSADFPGDADDTYVGFQMTTSLDSKYKSLLSGHSRYSYLLVKQKDGIKDGIALSRDSDGNRTLNYLRPSTTLDISQYEISKYAVPLMRLQARDGSSKGGTGKSADYAAAGLMVLLGFSLILKHDLEKKWQPAD